MISLDPRSVAVYRIGLAFLLLCDLLYTRMWDITAHYTDLGVLPRDIYIEKFDRDQTISFHLMSGAAWFQGILLSVQVAIASLMLIGWRSRIMTALSWVMLISLHSRNPYVLQGGDVLFRLLFFWGMFLPMGAVWSVDAYLQNREQDPPSFPKDIVSGGTFALMLQTFIVYWSTMALKTGVEWWEAGTAVHYALHIDHFATPLGVWLREQQGLTAFLTQATAVIEIAGPALALLAGNTLLRMLPILLMLGMHVSFGVTMKLGLFPWISMMTWLVLIPASAWDRLGLILEKAALSKRFAVTVNGLDRVISAIGFLLNKLKVLPKNTWGFRPRVRPIAFRSHPLTNLIAVSLLLYVFFWNLDGVRGHYKTKVKKVYAQFEWFWSEVPSLRKVDLPGYGAADIRKLGYVLRLDQKWSMFAPRPMRGDGWFIVPGVFADGTTVDLQTGETLDWDKPEYVPGTYKNQRWRKYLVNIWMATFKRHRRYYGKYLCNKYNKVNKGGKRLDRLWIYYMIERTNDTNDPDPVECRSLWSTWCNARGKELSDPPFVTKCKEIAKKGKAERKRLQELAASKGAQAKAN